MIRAMSTAVTGLRSHQLKMDAIGNNIANVNTFGYKNTQVRFEDLFNQTMQGATASTLYRGGSNPMQIGMGVKVGANIVNQGQGPIKCDRASDMAIEGNGFFVVSDGLNIFIPGTAPLAAMARGTWSTLMACMFWVGWARLPISASPTC